MFILVINNSERVFPRDYIARCINEVEATPEPKKKRGRGRPPKKPDFQKFYWVPFSIPPVKAEYILIYDRILVKPEHDPVWLLMNDLALLNLDLTQEGQRRSLMALLSEALIYDQRSYIKNSNSYALLMKHLHDSEDSEGWLKRFEAVEKKTKTLSNVLEDEDLQIVKEAPMACIVPFGKDDDAPT
jgi:hypothetical protein